MRLPLKHPIVVSDKTTITELNLRDHTLASDYLCFDIRGGVAQRIALIASVAGSDEAVVKRLHGVDYRRAEALVDKLLLEDEQAASADDESAADTAAKK